MGALRYPEATRLMVVADAGGSTSYRSRSFAVELTKLAATTGLVVTVCHMPPGTSKWKNIEHRLFSFISTNWRGKPFTTYRTVVELIAATTRTGHCVEADVDQRSHPIGVKISDAQLREVRLRPHDWHPDRNCSILPPERSTSCATGP